MSSITNFKALAWQVIFRGEDDRVIAPTAELRRKLANIVFTTGRKFKLLVFCSADTHLHNTLFCNRRLAGMFARELGIALSNTRGFPKLAPARIRPITSQFHLQNNFLYILGQHKKHGIEYDPFFDASSLPELLGLRNLDPEYPALVRSLLPRIKKKDLLEIAELNFSAEIKSLEKIADAAAAAVGIAELSGNEPEAVMAKRAAIRLFPARATSREISTYLPLSPRTIRRLRNQAVSGRLVKSVELQLRIRQKPQFHDSQSGQK